ncbi:MAG: sigma 54-interacting transcriptional regulator [Planctomycetota bacterium]
MSEPAAAPAEVRGFVVDPDAATAAEVVRVAGQCGIACTRLETPDALAEAARGGRAAIAFVDAACDTAAVGRALAFARSGTAPLSVVLLSADATARRVIRWIREGAADVVLKPFDAAELREAVARAAARTALSTRAARLPSASDDPFGAGAAGIVGDDPRLQRALDLARAAARVRSTVTIHGESGTGKSMLARAIHRASERGGGPFVEIACGSIPETLLESELFGHVKGAFTGALTDKKGRFLAADGGTIFLDEINSASPLLQLKLLRMLQERRFEPVGSDATIEVDVRVIAAGNQPLERLVSEGAFRQDLYYRLNVLAIELPPLRDRMPDLDSLARHFLEQKAAELGRAILGFTPAALAAMRAHAWPGNIRELENAIERAAVMCAGSWIEAEDLPLRGARQPAGAVVPVAPVVPVARGSADAPAEIGAAGPRSLADAMRAPEREALLAALRANGWNRSRTADSLGINRATLYRKMRDLGIEVATHGA